MGTLWRVSWHYIVIIILVALLNISNIINSMYVSYSDYEVFLVNNYKYYLVFQYISPPSIV